MPTIKELRERTGLSQSKFAALFHINLQTLQTWEQGVHKTPEYVIYLIDKLIAYEHLDQ